MTPLSACRPINSRQNTARSDISHSSGRENTITNLSTLHTASRCPSPCALYCPTEFEEAPKEHVIHAFLGTRWKDARLICADCQTAFSKGIDTALAGRLQPFRLLLGIEGDHGGIGRPLKGLAVTSGETVDLGPRGEPWLSRPHVRISKDGDRHLIQMKVPKEKDLAWGLSELRKALPHAELDPTEVRKLGVKKKERLEGEITFDLSLGGFDFFRAVLKCCANLFAAHDPACRDAFLGPAFDGVREFIRNGGGTSGDFARWLFSHDPLSLPRRGPADQALLLTTRGGSVEGVAQFFGHLPFAVRLTKEYAGPPIRCAYVVDPYREAEPAEQRMSGDELASYHEYIPVFVAQSPENNAEVQASWSAALNRFMAHYTERENEETVQRAVDEAIASDPRIAALGRDHVAEFLRKKARERLEEFERTGSSSKITVLRTDGRGFTPPSGAPGE